MNKMNNVLLGVVLVLVASYGLADGHGDVEGLKDSPSKTLARAWVTAGYSGTDKFLAMVKENMADDGVVVIPRFVGFGFLMDPNNQDQMVVARVIPGTPASGVLRQGDVFVSVAGVPATRENRDRVSFRGKPGQAVKAVVKREDKEIPIEITRGVIEQRSSKTTALDNLSTANPEDWPVDSFAIEEVIGEGNVVYVVSSFKETEAATGIQYTNRRINRFVFNDEGKVAWTSWRDESRFMLEQQGYTISR
jgi:hypothetical protein